MTLLAHQQLPTPLLFCKCVLKEMFNVLQKNNFIALDAKASHVHKRHC